MKIEYNLKIVLDMPGIVVNPPVIDTNLLKLALSQRGINTTVEVTEVLLQESSIFLSAPNNNRTNDTTIPLNSQTEEIPC